MHHVLRHLQRRQLLASFAVIFIAVITFGIVAFIANGERSTVETMAMLDDLEAHVYQLGSVHTSVGNANAVTDADLVLVARINQAIDADLEDFRSGVGAGTTYDTVKAGFNEYTDALDVMMADIQAGTLPPGESPQVERASTAVVSLAMTMRDARNDLAEQSASSYRTARIGYASAIFILVASVLVITRRTESALRRVLLEDERTRADRNRDRQISTLIQNISDTVIVLDPDGTIRYCSPTIERTLGVRVEDVIDTSILTLLHPDDVEENVQTLQAIVEGGTGGRPVTVVVRICRPDGHVMWVEAMATNRTDVPGIDGIVVNARDITERRQLDDQLRFHALHDSLTGLANRAVLGEQVKKAIQRRRTSGSTFAVMFVDLDNFKLVNDTWGHGVGDELLIGVAGRLRTVLRDGDTAARQGGDEFVLLIEDIASPADAERVAERIHAALTLPFGIDGQEFFTAASIGIYVFNGDVTASVDDALRFADIAMYRAKNSGRNRTCVYGTDSDSHDTDRLALETALRRSIEHDQLELYYQPIVASDSGQIIGLEALLRWNHPEMPGISPAAFLPVAEDTGLIVPIGDWVLETACSTLAGWREQFGDAAPFISVNLSSRQFRHAGLVATVAKSLERYDLPGNALMLEISESSLLGDTDLARKRLAALRQLGVQLALDDFGTGYTSLTHMQDLPIDVLKISRSFIAGTTERPDGQALMSGIVVLAHALDMQAVAAGVETIEQFAHLRDANADLAQGFYLYRPMPVAATEQLLMDRLVVEPVDGVLTNEVRHTTT